MDNVTHSLAGLLVAEAAARLRRRPPSRPARAAAPLLGVVAANLPDADVLYSAAAHDKLASLLHHRGYTHTLAAAAAGALLVWGLALLLLRRWRAHGTADPADPADAGDARWLLAVAGVAVFSHLALDWTNDYGVHPLSPFDDAWRYGDAMFIIEPWLWVIAVMALVFAFERPAARVGLALVAAAAVGLAWALPIVPLWPAVALTLGGLAVGVLMARLSPGRRAAAAVAGWLLVEGVFFAGTRAARASVRAAVAADPAASLVDVVVTPAPANPLCARAITVETAGDRYRLTTAWAAAAPSVLPAARCAVPGVLGVPSLPMRPAARPGTAAVRWVRTWDAPRRELAALARDNCHVAALLRFARVPFWFPVDAAMLHVGDLRYDRDPSVSFAEFLVPAVVTRPAGCPRDVPPWRPPRHDLLGGPAEAVRADPAVRAVADGTPSPNVRPGPRSTLRHPPAPIP